MGNPLHKKRAKVCNFSFLKSSSLQSLVLMLEIGSKRMSAEKKKYQKPKGVKTYIYIYSGRCIITRAMHSAAWSWLSRQVHASSWDNQSSSFSSGGQENSG